MINNCFQVLKIMQDIMHITACISYCIVPNCYTYIDIVILTM